MRVSIIKSGSSPPTWVLALFKLVLSMLEVI